MAKVKLMKKKSSKKTTSRKPPKKSTAPKERPKGLELVRKYAKNLDGIRNGSGVTTGLKLEYFAVVQIEKHRNGKPEEISKLVRKEYPDAAKRWNDPSFVRSFTGSYNRGQLPCQASGNIAKPGTPVILEGMRK